MTDNSGRQYSCRHCGHSYTAYPPDDGHLYLTIEQSNAGLPNIPITYTCPHCKQEIQVLWLEGDRLQS